MTSCKRAAERISQLRDGALSWWDRLMLWLHLLGCGMCRRFSQQVGLIEELGAEVGRKENAGPALPEAAKERIKQALREQAGE
jgi:hypothetical protein